ncbi:MAG: helix-turn-helix transcriptional regulator [bacterium]|nr:helix-turn-helix transcriptional regulator [bacterium]
MKANEFKEYRIVNKFTQEELSDLLGVSVDSIISYETGKRSVPQHVVNMVELNKKYMDEVSAHKALKKKFNLELETIKDHFRDKIFEMINKVNSTMTDYKYEFIKIVKDNQK